MHFGRRPIATVLSAIVVIAPILADRGASAQDDPAAPPTAAAPGAVPHAAVPHPPAPVAARVRTGPKKAPSKASVAPKRPVEVASPASPPPPAPGPASAAVSPPGPAVSPSSAAADAAAPPAPLAPAPAPQAPAGTAVGEAQSVVHARNAGITTCMDTIVAEAATVVDGAHTAMSGWNNNAPNAHLFESTIGLSYNSQTAPNGAAIILAAPLEGNRCEGATVQIYPFALSCSQIQANLIKSGHTVAALKNIPLVQTDTGLRDMLLPTAGNGCVLVSLGQRSSPGP